MEQELPLVLSVDSIPAYLAKRGVVSLTEQVRARVLPGGVSNLAFWVETPSRPMVVKQARPQLAVQMEWRADVNRIIREAEAMHWLHQRVGPPSIPRLWHLDPEAKVLVMEAIPEPAENYKTILLRGEVDPALAERFGSLLAQVHNVTCDEATRVNFADTAFFDQLRLSPYYGTVAERHPDLAPRLEALRNECLGPGYCLVHGDYSPKNVLVRDHELVLLDYEVAHWGNPSFDLGFALTHYLCKALHMPAQGHLFVGAARVFWNAYQKRCGLAEQSRAHAGHHLAAIMLARMDGKSPLEYFTDQARREGVRELTRGLLLAEDTSVAKVLRAVDERLP